MRQVVAKTLSSELVSTQPMNYYPTLDWMVGDNYNYNNDTITTTNLNLNRNTSNLDLNAQRGTITFTNGLSGTSGANGTSGTSGNSGASGASGKLMFMEFDKPAATYFKASDVLKKK